MKEIIEWLVHAEGRTCSIYNKAADYFHADEEFSGFVRRLAYDEKVHHAIITQVYDLVKGRNNLPSLIAVMSDTTRNEFDACLSGIEKGIEAGTLTRSALADHIISIEFCELNDAFAYMLTTMKDHDSQFRTAAINIHKHKMTIKQFLNSCNEFKEHLDRITHFPDIWEEKILIVDDEHVIIDVMQAILSKEGMIDTASNGRKALEKVQDKYYAAIISDISMPVMDGMDFYKRAVELYPSISKRFLFFTGRVDEKTEDFFREYNLSYLEKPSRLKDIRKKVIDILTAIP
ncbi:MAG: response regulator [Nitrospirae bacterium]|nr:response regulator [Nitrospirota bacterium]